MPGGNGRKMKDFAIDRMLKMNGLTLWYFKCTTFPIYPNLNLHVNSFTAILTWLSCVHVLCSCL